MTRWQSNRWWRWLVVVAAVTGLISLPRLVATWPAHVAAMPVEELFAKVVASTGQPYEGFAASSATAGLPSLPQLADSIALLNGETRLRVWYAGPDRWRVDQIGVGTETDVYQRPGVVTTWDFGRDQLTTVFGEQPLRLPRGADLVPPELARRVLALSGPGLATVTALAPRRVAGTAAAGLRIAPNDPHTTVARVDIWADPATGLPLEVELTGRGAATPVLVTRFLDIHIAAPDPATLVPPTGGAGTSHTSTNGSAVAQVFRSLRLGPLPDSLGGWRRVDDAATSAGVGVYGRGFVSFVVIPVPRRIGSDAFDQAKAAAGALLTLPGGDGVVVRTQLLTVMVMNSPPTRRSYLLAGFVDLDTLRQAGSDLSTFRGGTR